MCFAWVHYSLLPYRAQSNGWTNTCGNLYHVYMRVSTSHALKVSEQTQKPESISSAALQMEDVKNHTHMFSLGNTSTQPAGAFGNEVLGSQV